MKKNNTPQMQALKKINQNNKNKKEQKKYAPYTKEKKEKIEQKPIIKNKKTICPDQMVFTTGSPINKNQFKDIGQYKENPKHSTPTPEMAVVNKLNEQNKNKNNDKNKIYSAIKSEEKENKIKTEDIAIPKMKKPKKVVSLTDTPIDRQQVQSIKNYKEPEKMKQQSPEMAKLKKIRKPKKRNLILIKQTRSNPVQRPRPKPRSVVPPTKKIQVL
jgi:hypothetical protein